MAPVRARIASSSVVLPLWNGPTSAMHRGPVALVPFCAISASQSTEVRSSARPFAPSFQAGGGLGKRRLRLAHDGGTRMDMRSLHAHKNGRLEDGRSCIARRARNRQGPGRRCSSATPRANLIPAAVDTETGCNAIVLLEPPM